MTSRLRDLWACLLLVILGFLLEHVVFSRVADKHFWPTEPRFEVMSSLTQLSRSYNIGHHFGSLACDVCNHFWVRCGLLSYDVCNHVWTTFCKFECDWEGGGSCLGLLCESLGELLCHVWNQFVPIRIYFWVTAWGQFGPLRGHFLDRQCFCYPVLSRSLLVSWLVRSW